MNNPKKVLIFSTSYLPFVGGAEVAIKEITDRIPGVDFDIITGRFDFKLPKNEKIGNVNVFRIGFGFKTLDKFWLALFGHRKATKLYKEKKYDVVWSMMASQASIAAAKFKIKESKPKLILTMQEGDEENYLKRYVLNIDFLYNLLIKPLHLLIFKKADFGTAISNYLIERMRNNGMKVPIELIPNGVDVKKFDIELNLTERNNTRAALGLGGGDVALITTSRLVLKNGVGDVIKALPKLPENIKFVILGEGYLEKELKELAIKLNVSNRIIFKGFVEHSVLNKYLKASDIFIRASRSEGQGISFLEAMACKLPVIATPVGGIVDFLVDPSNILGQVSTGYFCQPENPESIAETVKRVMSDSQKNSVVENAYNMVKEKYDWDLIAGEMKKVFDI